MLNKIFLSNIDFISSEMLLLELVDIDVDKNEQSRAFKTLILQYTKTPSGKKNVFF